MEVRSRSRRSSRSLAGRSNRRGCSVETTTGSLDAGVRTAAGAWAAAAAAHHSPTMMPSPVLIFPDCVIATHGLTNPPRTARPPHLQNTEIKSFQKD
jgi:hypothetical protein